MKNIFYFVFTFFFYISFSQNADITQAILSLQDNEIIKAKEAIDKAEEKIASGSLLKPKKMSRYYYNRGMIYFKTYLSDTINNSRMEFLHVAVD